MSNGYKSNLNNNSTFVEDELDWNNTITVFNER